MTVKRMDNVGILADELDAAVEFFTEPTGDSSRRERWTRSGRQSPSSTITSLRRSAGKVEGAS